MQIIKTIEDMKVLSRKVRSEGKAIGFVPTMGYLHEGHLSLVRRCKEICGFTVVSVFINPKQFAKNEDLDVYPSSPKKDQKQLENIKVDALFIPQQEMIYPKRFKTNVDVEEITNRMCGISRPGFFRGVATIILKLFNIVQPDKAFFGEKDRQQVEVIRTMTRDLNLDIEIESLPLIREKDGLAMSSRNYYLTKTERRSALSLNRALKVARAMVENGESSAEKIKREIRDVILSEPHTSIDYISVCDAETFADRERVSGKAVIALAVHIGRARLIDNCIVEKV
tara:strand:- start:679 stop:1527 length:849 start_codon:yes stop_codon:yes gene_type:complete